jgi:predicted Zn-dependent protease
LNVNAAPYVPAHDDEVLERLPETTNLAFAELKRMRLALNAEPQNLDRATQLAWRYIALGRAEADPRYYGYAQAALQPWWQDEDAPNSVLLLRASLRQNRHEFGPALDDLQRLLRRDSRNAQAWLTRAVILQVVGDYSAAKESCVPLLKLADTLTAMTCLSSVAALDGEAARGYELLAQTLQGADSNGEVRVWALTALAEIAARLGKDREADEHFRAALALDTRDVYLLAAYADFLLDQNRPREVVDRIGDNIKIDGLLLRLALAEQRLNASELPAHIKTLKARFEASRLRGEALHQGEEARFTLHLLNDPKAALSVAKANWAVQREPRDGRILLEAAIAANTPADAQPVINLLQKAWKDDLILRRLATDRSYGNSAKVSRASLDVRSRTASHETYQVDRRVTSEHATKQVGCAVAFAELP